MCNASTGLDHAYNMTRCPCVCQAVLVSRATGDRQDRPDHRGLMGKQVPRARPDTLVTLVYWVRRVPMDRPELQVSDP